MVSITISVPETVYDWLAKKASTSDQTVEALIEEEVQRLPEDDPDDPEFLAVVRASIQTNRELLKRLAE